MVRLVVGVAAPALVTLFLVACCWTTSYGFSSVLRRQQTTTFVGTVTRSTGSTFIRLNAEQQDQQPPSSSSEAAASMGDNIVSQEDETTQEEESTVASNDDDDDESEKDDDDEEQEEEPQEDPEIVALKQEIFDLESSLKAKEREVAYQMEKVEEYSKAGYARKVAEMETMRRTRSRMNSSSREAAVASVLEQFLPVLDDFIELETKYATDDFGKSFNALGGAMRTALKEMGVTEYAVEPGDIVDRRRVLVVDEEYSDDFAKDVIIRPIEVGLELQGNVMRMAECVASLGSESEAKAAAEEEAAGAAAAAESDEEVAEEERQETEEVEGEEGTNAEE